MCSVILFLNKSEKLYDTIKDKYTLKKAIGTVCNAILATKEITMQENYELVLKGFRVLVGSMSAYIGQTLDKVYKDDWWDEVLSVLKYPKDLPVRGTYSELVDSLDIANCLRIIEWMWGSVYRNLLSPSCRAWAKELMGVRNSVAHIGQQDLDQPMAERALDTMALLCAEIDPDSTEEIREIYKEVRARANDTVRPTMIVRGAEQPESESKRGALQEGSLLKLVGTDTVQKTTLTRKVTYGGKTVVYPVYKVRLDALYYNDQNDRIATWITQYESEYGTDSLSSLNTDIYNQIIENFVVDSNPESIKKTQKNIALVGQREPGVTLADGRIVDGNRRFTCLRRIQRLQEEPVYFETVLMDMDIREDKKQIKLLELAIQHGEEKKVDYDMIDFAIGTYRDVIQTKLLTVDEYADSTNESLADVKKRIAVAELICEFLENIGLPEQYHIAREYQVFDLFREMMTPLKKLDEVEKKKLKTTVFDSVLIKAIQDQRKFIRDINGLVRNDAYKKYFDDQQKWDAAIREKLAETDIHGKEDLDRFADENTEIAVKMADSMERALLRSRTQKLKEVPSENVAKCISLMMDVDTRFFDRMNIEEKENLKAELDELIRIADTFKGLL